MAWLKSAESCFHTSLSPVTGCCSDFVVVPIGLSLAELPQMELEANSATNLCMSCKLPACDRCVCRGGFGAWA